MKQDKNRKKDRRVPNLKDSIRRISIQKEKDFEKELDGKRTRMGRRTGECQKQDRGMSTTQRMIFIYEQEAGPDEAVTKIAL